jgi:hypothetical protein
MKHIRIPVPSIRWLTISWGEHTPAPTPTPAPVMEHTDTQVSAPRYNNRTGQYGRWLKETGRTRKAWERYYQLDRTRMELMVMRTGHKAPFTQQEIVAQGDLFRRYLTQRTDPETQGRGRPRLRSV